MSEPTRPGMGRPSGPGFTGPPPTGAPPTGAPPTGAGQPFGSRHVAAAPRPGSAGDRQGRGGPRPPRTNRLATALAVAAVAVVATIVAVASVVAAREDVRQAAPRSPARASQTPSPAPTDRIEFTTNAGSGVLEITDHAWDTDGSDTDAPGPLLTVAVRVTCESGMLRYGPDSFQAFDRDGQLFEPEVLPDSPSALELGTLSAGQHVTGTVAFDIPRGPVTLLMSDEFSRTVTALRVPD